MTNAEIREKLSALQEMEFYLSEEYDNNGGEVTNVTEAQEASIQALRDLLTTEGVDSLGRWLKAKEDEVNTLKAEKDSVTRKINAANDCIDYIKSQINSVMTATGVEKVKGTFYSFTPTTKHESKVDKDLLKFNYEAKVKDALVKASIPAYIGVTLTASIAKVTEDGVAEEDAQLFSVVDKPSVRFTKPRAAKQEEE